MFLILFLAGFVESDPLALCIIKGMGTKRARERVRAKAGAGGNKKSVVAAVTIVQVCPASLLICKVPTKEHLASGSFYILGGWLRPAPHPEES